MDSKKKRHEYSRTAETNTVKSALQELLSTYKIKDKFTATQITSSWGKIMGEPIAKRTDKIYMKNKKLFIKITSAPLKNELSLSKQRIKSLFQKEFGENAVEEIIFL